ncbi:NUDIX hydrolase [Jeotgalibacillus malaysiensis]|uniref:NUDIX hydrolase n=1 Tax=Jeotgalibacillus malaysiensis TaxID=1508404 RepID=UPI00384BCCE8
MHSPPKHIIAVSANVVNDQGQTLLVKTHLRPDTWETPGGQVEPGEPLDQALSREVLEETGLVISPAGITGVYYNVTKHLLAVVFKAKYISGDIKIQPEEIKEAKFVELTEENIGQYITRPNMQSRTLDCMKAENVVPYETWEVTPYNLLGRLS